MNLFSGQNAKVQSSPAGEGCYEVPEGDKVEEAGWRDVRLQQMHVSL